MIRFLAWWNRNTTNWIIILAVIQIAQIPHMVWNADLYLSLGIISRQNIILDFFLYGIDLIEVPSIMIAITTVVARIKGAK